MRYRRTQRFDAAILVAIVLVAVGGIFGNDAIFLAAAVPVWYLFVAAVTAPPPAAALDLTRSFEPSVAAPGQRATVTVSVENAGDRTLSDVRVVDGVPDQLPVVAGSPRGCLSLRPGETARLEYEVVASQGDHEFGRPVVRLRPLSGVGRATGRFDAGEATLRCRRAVGGVETAVGALRLAGTEPTDSPGPGTTFHSVREYRAGDSLGRVDWRQLAKSGTLSTINFEATRATETLLVVDGRPSARIARDDGYPTAAELSAYAADLAATRLLTAGNKVGLTALGISGSDVEVAVPTDRSGHPWVEPGTSAVVRDRIEAVLDGVVARSQAREPEPQATADGGRTSIDGRGIRQKLSKRIDVVVVTPALDDEPVALAESLAAAGHAVSVVSPDVTGRQRPGARLAGAERETRMRRLGASATAVVDWDTTAPLSLALERDR
jgi:uncharacterized repeat protein (TIGR01451 family)